MKAGLLSAHVLAAITTLGPIAVAASAFPRYARAVATAPDPVGDRAVASVLHRISRGYAIPALAVPVLGMGVGSALGVLGQAWVLVSMALTVCAAVLLAAVVVPGQRRVLDGLDQATSATRAIAELPRLAMVTGLFTSPGRSSSC